MDAERRSVGILVQLPFPGGSAVVLKHIMGHFYVRQNSVATFYWIPIYIKSYGTVLLNLVKSKEFQIFQLKCLLHFF